MSMPNNQAQSTAAIAVTAQYDFQDVTSYGGSLFSVRAGIPLNDAFEHLSLLLANSKSTVSDVCNTIEAGGVPEGQWAALQSLEWCLSLVQAMHHGLMAHERQQGMATEGKDMPTPDVGHAC